MCSHGVTQEVWGWKGPFRVAFSNPQVWSLQRNDIFRAVCPSCPLKGFLGESLVSPACHQTSLEAKSEIAGVCNEPVEPHVQWASSKNSF